MRLIIFILSLLLSTPSLCSELDSVKQLRTLFTSASVRSQLDQQRKSGKFINHSVTTSTPVLRKPIKVELQGVVLRDDKQPVVFVNNTNTLESRQVGEGVSVRDTQITKDALAVPLRVNQQPVTLKPGQQWSETNGKTLDSYQIKPHKPEPEGIAEPTSSVIIE